MSGAHDNGKNPMHPNTWRRKRRYMLQSIIQQTHGEKQQEAILPIQNISTSQQDTEDKREQIIYHPANKKMIRRTLQEKYPLYKINSDIGSGLNYKRRSLKTVLERVMQKSKQLWLPTEIDGVDLEWSSLNGSFDFTKSKSSLIVQKMIPNKKNLHKTFFPSYKYSMQGTMAKEDTAPKLTKTQKLKLRLLNNDEENSPLKNYQNRTATDIPAIQNTEHMET
jgi:hypothetical protein